MGPLQYMVMGYEPTHFNREIIPELAMLSRKGVIRLVDLLFVTRDSEGVVTSREVEEVIPNYRKLIFNSRGKSAEWFVQDDVEVVGESLPNASSVALLLFEHLWAIRLDKAVHYANGDLSKSGSPLGGAAGEIEHLLTVYTVDSEGRRPA